MEPPSSLLKTHSPPLSFKSTPLPATRVDHPLNPSSAPPSSPHSSANLRFRISVAHDAKFTDSSQSRDLKPLRPLGRDSSIKDAGRDESSNRARSSISRKAPGCEKYMSMRALSLERERSDDTQRISDSDKDHVMMSSLGKRSRGGDDRHGRQVASEQSNKSLLRDERDPVGMLLSIAARKGPGSDKKRYSESRDASFGKGPLRSQEDHTFIVRENLLNECTVFKSSPKEREMPQEKKHLPEGRLPFKKAFRTLRALTEMDNSKDHPVKKRDRVSSSGEMDTGIGKKISFGGASDAGKDRDVFLQQPNVDDSQSILDFPIKFSHVAKRARSHRDRRKQEKLAYSDVWQEGGRIKLEEASKQSGSLVAEVSEQTSGTAPESEVRLQGGGDHVVLSKDADDTKRQFLPGLTFNQVEEAVEVQSEPEGKLAVEQHALQWPNEKGDMPGVQDKNENMDITAPEDVAAGKEGGVRKSWEASNMGAQENRDLHVCHEDEWKSGNVCGLGDAEGDHDRKVVHPTDNSVVSLPLSMEVCTNTNAGSTMDFLDKTSMGKGHSKQNRGNTGLESSNKLTLSLFTEPTGANGEGITKFENESEKHLWRAGVMQASRSQNSLDGFHEGGGDHVNLLKTSTYQLSLSLPGSSTAAAFSSTLVCVVAPERGTHMYTQMQSQSHTHNFSQSQAQTNDGQLSQGNEYASQRSWQSVSADAQFAGGYNGTTSLSQDRSKHRHGISLYQMALQNGNNRAFPSASASNRSCGGNQASQRNRSSGLKVHVETKILDSSLQDLESIGRQDVKRSESFDRFSTQQDEEAWQLSASRETRSESRAQRDTSPMKKNSSGQSGDARGDRGIFCEKIGLHEIATDPVAIMAQKMQDLPGSVLEGLKGLAKDLLGSFEKREEFLALQNIIKRRTDLTEHTLLHAHQTQLEILVALKTAMQSFVQKGAKPLTYKVLTEIFLQTRCRNIICQRTLPVDGCECKICSQKGGFCHDCMCMVCFKFDSDNQICRWVGCDVCEHWCHTDCGLRLSYIAPGQSDERIAGHTEMQFRCVACGRHSELFNFVKGVFQQYADGWGAETLTKELDCVRRIFHGSEYVREKQLCLKVEEMLRKLENKVDITEVRRSILSFFTDGTAGARASENKQSPSLKTNELTDRVVKSTQEATMQAPTGQGGKLAHVDKAFNKEFHEKRTETIELDFGRAQKRAEIENIQSMMRVKHAEIKMLQLRADEAHQEAKGLQQIITVKQEKFEEDYLCRYAKLRLDEAKEKRRKRLEELQALERAQFDYQKMKVRMETQIKDLVMKMEMAKWQYA